MADDLNLVILAAGLGSRFGGDKQLEPVGPLDEPLLDYTVFDAHRAGFKRVVFVIRHNMIRAFHPFARRFRNRLEVRIAFQYIEDAPKDVNIRARSKPWGTGQALLTAAPHVSGGFAVCNADDYYGAEAFGAAVEHLNRPPKGRTTWGLIGYPAEATLSNEGPVNRAVCRLGAGDHLTDLEEQPLDAASAKPGMIVSMNFWCFTQEIFGMLQSGFDEFALRAAPDDEFLLPDVVRAAVRDDAARVKVMRPGSRWFGLTHPGDLPRVREALRELAASGHYPARLWSDPPPASSLA